MYHVIPVAIASGHLKIIEFRNKISLNKQHNRIFL